MRHLETVRHLDSETPVNSETRLQTVTVCVFGGVDKDCWCFHDLYFSSFVFNILKMFGEVL